MAQSELKWSGAAVVTNWETDENVETLFAAGGRILCPFISVIPIPTTLYHQNTQTLKPLVKGKYLCMIILGLYKHTFSLGPYQTLLLKVSQFLIMPGVE
mgnify:CR=1 FL=1